MEWWRALGEAVQTPKGSAQQIRHSKRLQADLPARIVLAEGNVPCTVVNFSDKGLRIRASQSLPKDTYVSLVLEGQMPADNRARPPVLNLKARIVWCRRGEQTGEFESGLEYVAVSGASFDEVVDFFKTQVQVRAVGPHARPPVARRKVRVRWKSKTGFEEGFVRDVTSSAIRFAIRQRQSEGAQLLVQLDLRDGKAALETTVRISRCHAVPGQSWFDVTAPLTHLGDEDKLRLEAVLGLTP